MEEEPPNFSCKKDKNIKNYMKGEEICKELTFFFHVKKTEKSNFIWKIQESIKLYYLFNINLFLVGVCRFKVPYHKKSKQKGYFKVL